MKWKAELIQHKKESRIAVYFENTPELNARIKKLEDVKWSQTLKVWHLPDTLENRAKFKLSLPVKINENKLLKIEQFKRWMSSKRYSENTIKTYTEALSTFLKYFDKKAIENINNEDIIAFNNDYILQHQLSAAYQNQVVNALKLFYRQVEGTMLNLDLIHRPKKPKLLPNVLSKEEIKLILDAHSNIKHKAMLSLI